MYGPVNAAFRELVISQHGITAWERICTAAGLSVDTFARMQPDPDEATYRMVEERAKTIDLARDVSSAPVNLAKYRVMPRSEWQE